MPLLPADFAELARFPALSRRLRLGVVGGGRIAGTQAIAARLSDRWDVVAGALSSRPDAAQQRAAAFYINPDRAYTGFEAMAQAETRRSSHCVRPNRRHRNSLTMTGFRNQGIPAFRRCGSTM